MTLFKEFENGQSFRRLSLNLGDPSGEGLLVGSTAGAPFGMEGGSTAPG